MIKYFIFINMISQLLVSIMTIDLHFNKYNLFVKYMVHYDHIKTTEDKKVIINVINLENYCKFEELLSQMYINSVIIIILLSFILYLYFFVYKKEKEVNKVTYLVGILLVIILLLLFYGLNFYSLYNIKLNMSEYLPEFIDLHLKIETK